MPSAFVRTSFCLYKTGAEVERFLGVLDDIVRHRLTERRGATC